MMIYSNSNSTNDNRNSNSNSDSNSINSSGNMPPGGRGRQITTTIDIILEFESNKFLNKGGEVGFLSAPSNFLAR